MEPGCSFARAVPLHPLLPHPYPSSAASSFSAAVSRSTLLQSQRTAARGSRAWTQWDDQERDAGAAHLVRDSPHLTWSKSPSPPLVVSRERLAETDSSRSRADVRRTSAIPHLGRACFSFSVKGVGQLISARGLQPGSSASPRRSRGPYRQPGFLISTYGKSNTHRIGSYQPVPVLGRALLSGFRDKSSRRVQDLHQGRG